MRRPSLVALLLVAGHALGQPERYELGRRAHAFEVAWNHELGLWIAVVGGGSVLYLDPRGRIVRRETVMLPGHRCLAPTGDVLVDARGRVFDVARARTRLELAADGRGPARSPGAGRA